MKKQEWKTQYQAARILLNARHSRDYNSPGAKQAWNAAYQHVTKNMHPSIHYAAFNDGDTVYSIKSNGWAAKHNSKVFNRKRTFKSCRFYNQNCYFEKNKVYFYE